MSQTPHDAVVSSETRTSEAQPHSSSSQDKAGGQSPEKCIQNFKKFWEAVVLVLQPVISLSWRSIQLCAVHEDFISVIVDLWLLCLPDLLYPLASLKKRKSERLAGLLLEHSKDKKIGNLHVASSPKAGVDPPRVAVIHLDDAPPEIIKNGYAVSADFYGFAVVVVFLDILVSRLLHHLSSNEFEGYYHGRLGWWLTSIFSDRFAARVASSASTFFNAAFHWTNTIILIIGFCVSGSFFGESILSLVRKSDVSTPSCAVLMDRDFTLVVTGTQNIVEAIAESGFGVSHPSMGKRSLTVTEFQLVVYFVGCFCFGLVDWFQQGIRSLVSLQWMPSIGSFRWTPSITSLAQLFAPKRSLTLTPSPTHPPRDIKMGFWRLVSTMLLIKATLPTLLFATFDLERTFNQEIREYSASLWATLSPTNLLSILHVVTGLLAATISNYVSCENHYPIRSAQFLDIIGNPPVHRWEFDTLSAAATFQCLIVCRGLPRPVKKVDVLALMDTFVLDDTDIWTVWKARVSDRIAHEEDISFAPTIPSFGDERQKVLKERLDQAQLAYDVYRNFYDKYVPKYSIVAKETSSS